MEVAASIGPQMASKIAEVIKIRSIGVFRTEIKELDQVYKMISSNAVAELDEEQDDVDEQKKGNVCSHFEIVKLFETLLDLKLAYVRLQEAHVPYDPEKIRAADEDVVSRFEMLCKIKKTYKEKLLKEGDYDSAILIAEVKLKERTLKKMKSYAKFKENTAKKLHRELCELEKWNRILAEDIRTRERERVLKSLNHKSFENVVQSVGKAIHDFVKLLITLMKVSGWDLDEAADAIQTSVAYAKRSHKKFAFEAYVARRMFQGFATPQACFFENVMKSDDPILALMEDPRSCFAKFCCTKYLSVVHPEMEMSFFGNLDHRNSVANGIHPFTSYYRAFVTMARCVWYLQGFSSCVEPKVEMFGVKEGSEFLGDHMEVVEELKEYKLAMDEKYEGCKVEFFVMPGFVIRENLVRSRVYISKLVV
ncbi:protein GRAVITROPIC IN THE LIGHT 1-like isoform X2 [Andrographis paniculata]|nr:protein GRAVITROPIC IN THE LIGHT 1-like isoform X2 [Andrographis paniculata]XP_051143491.1 protein GRAVITROPIC IN THE LIGHT 1-like isoform X2 [Andrographis paniculata]